MQRICLIIQSLQSGGMERVMSELANHFAAKDDVEVHVVLYGKRRDIFYTISESIIVHKPSFEFAMYSRVFSSLKTLFSLRRTIRKIAPDTILSFGEYWNSFVLLALWGLKFPIYISDRCQPDKSLGRLHDQLRKWLYPKAAGIIAQTSEAKEIYTAQGLNPNIQVIGNPIRSIGSNGNGHRKENTILTVGRLIDTKHHDRLIKMFKALEPTGWKLVIAGGDALKQTGMQKLKQLVNELGLEESVELAGTVEDIDRYYQQSQIFAFTSSSEGFPNVIGEAMSAGLPVISYDCIAGPSDMIEDGKNGFLVPLFNDEQYVKKLNALVNDENLRRQMGKTSKELVQKFAVDKTAEKYYQFITGVK